jgi:hypothetical protein
MNSKDNIVGPFRNRKKWRRKKRKLRNKWLKKKSMHLMLINLDLARMIIDK